VIPQPGRFAFTATSVVTCSHILHGSAILLRQHTDQIALGCWWGIKFKGADPFIKFALGENVKRTTSPLITASPIHDWWKGMVDAFTRARDYEKNGRKLMTIIKRKALHQCCSPDLDWCTGEILIRKDLLPATLMYKWNTATILLLKDLDLR